MADLANSLKNQLPKPLRPRKDTRTRQDRTMRQAALFDEQLPWMIQAVSRYRCAQDGRFEFTDWEVIPGEVSECTVMGLQGL